MPVRGQEHGVLRMELRLVRHLSQLRDKLLVVLHRAVDHLGRVHLPEVGHLPLGSRYPVVCDLIHLVVDLPVQSRVVVLQELVVLGDVQWNHLLAPDDHHDPLRLPGPDLDLEVALLLLQNLGVNAGVGLVLLLVHIHLGGDVALQREVIRVQVRLV